MQNVGDKNVNYYSIMYKFVSSITRGNGGWEQEDMG